MRGMDVLWDLPTKRGGEKGAGHGTPEVGTGRQSRTTGSKARGWSPGARGVGALRGLRALQQLAQDVVDVREFGSLAAVLLPAVEHELVKGWLAVHRGGQAEPILHSLHHLRRQEGGGGERRGQALRCRSQANPWGKPPSSHPAWGAAAAPPAPPCTAEPPAHH